MREIAPHKNLFALSPPCPADTGSQQRAQSLAGVFDRARRIDRSETRFLFGAVLHRLRIESENFALAAFFQALIKSAPGFFAEPAALQQFFDDGRQLEHFARFIAGNIFVKIANNVSENIDANNIRGSERGGFRPADSGTGTRVHFFDGHAKFGHHAQRVEHGKSADAIGNKIWRVFRDHDAFAERAIAKFAERLQNFRRGGFAGNQFHQFHVARRIEKVRAQPVAAEIFAAAFFDAVDRQAGSIRGNDCAGRAMNSIRERSERLISKFSATASTIQSAFAHQSRLSSKFPVMIRCARAGSEKCRGPRFQRGFEPSARDAIADFGTRERQASRFFRGVQFGGNDIEQKSFHAGVREMRGDSRAHRACAENHRAIDSFFHGRCA